MRGVEDKKTGDKDDCIQDCKKPKFASSVEKYKRGRFNFYQFTSSSFALPLMMAAVLSLKLIQV